MKLTGLTYVYHYGGSVKPTNAKEILGAENVNGALIGGACLEMESLAAIARDA
ncbi:triose-phosphate isomerase [Hellea sp.]|nr:triose-phosphate isomerase [Hellea sp.]